MLSDHISTKDIIMRLVPVNNPHISVRIIIFLRPFSFIVAHILQAKTSDIQ